MDVNFKLKGKNREFSDPPLGNGLGYMVSNDMLQAHLTKCIMKKLTSEVFAYHCIYIILDTAHSRSILAG